VAVVAIGVAMMVAADVALQRWNSGGQGGGAKA
jgi:hypothetical protein